MTQNRDKTPRYAHDNTVTPLAEPETRPAATQAWLHVPETTVYLAALVEAKELGNRGVTALLQREPNPKALWEMSTDDLRALGMTADGAQLLARYRQKTDLEAIARRWQPDDTVMTVINTWQDGARDEAMAWPPVLQRLLATADPPLLLYVRGDASVLAEPCWQRSLAVVGTRAPDEYGQRVTATLITTLPPCGIISGLARGIDGLAHEAALNAGLPTLAVLGTGVDVIYPTEHKALASRVLDAGGLIVSEYRPGTPPEGFRFPARNRIVAGMAEGVLVVQGRTRSGSGITARLAADEGRTVLAVPGNIFNPLSQVAHGLLADGATPVGSADDIVAALGWQPAQARLDFEAGLIEDAATEEAPVPESSAFEGKPAMADVYAAVGYEPTAIDAIVAATGLPAAEVFQLLTLLELNGQVKNLPGSRVCRVA